MALNECSCWTIVLLMKGKYTALGNLPGIEEPTGPIQGHCKKALPAQEGQHNSNLQAMDSGCKERRRKRSRLKNARLPDILAEAT